MMNFLRLLLLREVCIAHKHFGDNAIIVLFFLLAAILFPLGVGPEPKLLAIMGPGILWVIALLASLLSFGKLFWAFSFACWAALIKFGFGACKISK